MLTSDFDYDLPPDRIAQVPPPERAQSRMLVVHCSEGRFEHRMIGDLGQYLHAPDLLVVNNTRVIPARLLGRRPDTGGQVEVFLLEDRGEGRWEALYHAGSRPRIGMVVELGDGHITGEIVEALGAGRVIVRLASREPLAEALAAYGVTPVPPYIARGAADARADLDRERYQTVYARHPGAVAAPTAGLHFSRDLLERLAGQGIKRAEVTLHVGPGTFKPVKSERVDEHQMEPERYWLPPETAEAIGQAQAGGGRVVAVGSTTTRTLETIARDHGRIVSCEGRSALFIHPPYAFRAVNVMLTNFHLPRSTLLMMVSAFAGWRMGADVDPDGAQVGGRDLLLRAYGEAIAQGYRFYSYGDCMLLQ